MRGGDLTVISIQFDGAFYILNISQWQKRRRKLACRTLGVFNVRRQIATTMGISSESTGRRK